MNNREINTALVLSFFAMVGAIAIKEECLIPITAVCFTVATIIKLLKWVSE